MSVINRDPTVPLTPESARHFQKYDPIAGSMVLFERVQLSEEVRVMSQRVVLPLGPDAAADRTTFWVSPALPITVTGFQVVAETAITGTGAVVDLELIAGAVAVANTAELVGAAIADALFAGTVVAGAIPAGSLLKATVTTDTAAGGLGLCAVLTYVFA